MNIKKCGHCGDSLIRPRGPKESDILIISEFPGKQELEELKPFVGPAGRVLRTELAKAGFDMSAIRITNVWLHDRNDQEECYMLGKEAAVKEAEGKKAIILAGSSVVKDFLGKGVLSVSGLNMKCDMLSAPIIMPMPNPANAIQGTVGEIRLSLYKFGEMYHSENLPQNKLEIENEINSG